MQCATAAAAPSRVLAVSPARAPAALRLGGSTERLAIPARRPVRRPLQLRASAEAATTAAATAAVTDDAAAATWASFAEAVSGEWVSEGEPTQGSCGCVRWECITSR